MSNRPTTAAWIPGAILGAFAGLLAHRVAPGIFPGWTWAPWVVAGLVAPYAWLYRQQVPAKLTTVFITFLALAMPLVTPVLAVAAGLAVMLAFLITDALP